MGNRNITVIATLLSVVIMLLLFSFTHSLRTGDGSKALDEILSVAMPRPIKEMILGFTLEGRSVIHDIEGVVIGTSTTADKTHKKMTVNGTKALTDKGQKQKAHSAQAAVIARAQLNEKRRRAFEARVIEQANRYRESLKLNALSDSYVESKSEDNWIKEDNKMVDAGDNQDRPDDKVDKRTAAEWKSLILTQPTQANVEKMIKAVNSGEIDIDTYLEISESLIKDNSQDKRRLGVWALTSIYRNEAFISASHLAIETDVTTRKILTDYLYNYNRTQTLGVFEFVLKSTDSVAASAAADAISKAIQNIQSVSNPNTSGRDGSRSGGTNQQLTMSSYKRLLPTLQFVVAKNLNNLSQWAQTLISQLQTITTTA